MRRKNVINFVQIGCLLLLTACHPKQGSPRGQATLIPTAEKEQATQTLEIIAQSTSTAVLAGENEASYAQSIATPGESAAVIPSPAADPLKLAFPTPGTGRVSTWRPPMYPVPWAPTTHDHFYFARPVAADQINWPEADYRYGGEFFENVIHTGVDIPVFEGTPVLAAGPGKIVWANYGIYRGGYDTTDPYGLAIVIRHDFGYQDQTLYTLYGHLSEIKVVVGQHVETGELIGLSGHTGKVTGPHLHFEVRLGENEFFATRNPELWIAPPQGWGVLAGRVMLSSGELLTGQYVILTAQDGENFFARTYGAGTVNSDPYYQENVVIGDLPAGKYMIRIFYGGGTYAGEVTINPGLVSYFEFRGFYGYVNALPLGAREDYSPLTTSTPTQRP